VREAKICYPLARFSFLALVLQSSSNSNSSSSSSSTSASSVEWQQNNQQANFVRTAYLKKEDVSLIPNYSS
jgi:hypothetical protein